MNFNTITKHLQNDNELAEEQLKENYFRKKKIFALVRFHA